jgi:predicted short-subunit dehydrogenase-like oxidoreductase (DUF2520 family)
MLAQRMKDTLSIVGAGRAGRGLGRVLHDLGWKIQIVADRNLTKARAAVRAIGAGIPADELNRQMLESAVVLITTQDGLIESVAKELAEIGGQEWRGKIVLHTSGALDCSALKPLADLGAATGSVHPMQTFGEQSPPELAGRTFGIEGSPVALKVSRKMVRQMGGVAVRLLGANKAAYHSSAVFASGHVLALMETAIRLLMAQGFTRRQAVRTLVPLTRQTLDNFESLGARAAWTGPIARGDYATMQRHVKALEDFPPEYLDAYMALARVAAVVVSAEPDATKRQLDNLFGLGTGRTKKSA